MIYRLLRLCILTKISCWNSYLLSFAVKHKSSHQLPKKLLQLAREISAFSTNCTKPAIISILQVLSQSNNLCSIVVCETQRSTEKSRMVLHWRLFFISSIKGYPNLVFNSLNHIARRNNVHIELNMNPVIKHVSLRFYCSVIPSVNDIHRRKNSCQHFMYFYDAPPFEKLPHGLQQASDQIRRIVLNCLKSDKDLFFNVHNITITVKIARSLLTWC